MARSKISIEDKIRRAEAEVLKTKARYDEAVEVLNTLLTKKRELESKELLKAFEKSDRSLEEILTFLGQSGAD